MPTATKPNTTRPRRAPTPPGQDTGAFTFLDIGLRLHTIGRERTAVFARQEGHAEHTSEYASCEALIHILTDEETALQDLILAMEPKTLEDAAVQAGAMFCAVSRASHGCLPRRTRHLPAMQPLLRRVFACLTSVLSKSAGVNLSEVGDEDLSGLIALDCPSHIVEPVDGELVA